MSNTEELVKLVGIDCLEPDHWRFRFKVDAGGECVTFTVDTTVSGPIDLNRELEAAYSALAEMLYDRSELAARYAFTVMGPKGA